MTISIRLPTVDFSITQLTKGPPKTIVSMYTKEEVDKLIEDIIAEFNLKLQILKDEFNHYKQEHQARKH